MITIKYINTDDLLKLAVYSVEDANPKGVITEELGNNWGQWTIDEWEMEDADELIDMFKPLIGYKVSYDKDGSHKHDGQMVGYDFTFESPSGEITKISTEMCLMIGWNYHKDIIIK